MSTSDWRFRSLEDREEAVDGEEACGKHELDLSSKVLRASFYFVIFIASVVGGLNQVFGFIVVLRHGIIVEMLLVLERLQVNGEVAREGVTKSALTVGTCDGDS